MFMFDQLIKNIQVDAVLFVFRFKPRQYHSLSKRCGIIGGLQFLIETALFKFKSREVLFSL